ncbi:MAG: hypothetical protein K2H81_00155 [Alistipes sp.]|nr:hypothetical protein [Alistipes sp.]
MTRKHRYIPLLLSSLFLLAAAGCDRNKTNFVFHENFIEVYLENDKWGISLREGYDKPPFYNEPPYHYILLCDNGPSSKRIDKESSPVRFERLAERNGDTSFNRWIDHWRADPSDWPYTVYTWADNFQSMHVTSDADWDEAHPAGTPLDDILRIKIETYAEFVRSGYQTYPHISIEKSMLISELTPEDMEMIACYPEIRFTSAPTISPNHTLTLEWTTIEGRVITASLDCSEATEALWHEARQSD